MYQTQLQIRRDFTEKMDNMNYFDALEECGTIQSDIEKVSDRELVQRWQSVNEKCELNIRYQKRYSDLKKLVESGEKQDAFRWLVDLLKEVNQGKPDELIDKRIVSDIMMLLKEVSEELEQR